jgi:hypothetical protein
MGQVAAVAAQRRLRLQACPTALLLHRESDVDSFIGHRIKSNFE